MAPLFTLSARSIAVASALVFTLALFGALVRVLPWLVAREVPLAVSVVFFEALTSRGAEMAALVGIPTGAAVASALLVERGEARALLALGARPSRLAASIAPLAIGAALAMTALAESTRSTGAERFASELVSAGRAACGASGRSNRVDVPLLSLSWLCFAPGPRLVGLVPGVRTPIWFTASDLRADSSGLLLDDLRIAAPRLAVTLRARHGHVAGLGGAAHGSLGGFWHAFVVSALSVSTAVASAWAILGGGLASPLAAAFNAGTAALVGGMALRALSDRHAGLGGTLAVVPAGAAVALLLHAVLGAFLRSRIAGRKAW